MQALVLGEVPAADLAARLRHLGAALPDAWLALWLAGAGLVLPLALLGAWWARARGWVVGWGLYLALMPPVVLLAAPAVAASGTVFRSGAALFPAACALAAFAVTRLGALAAARRGYPPRLLPALAAAGVVAGSAGSGFISWRARPAPPLDCASLAPLPPGEVIFAGDPLDAWSRCGRPAVGLPVGITPERLRVLSERFQIRCAQPAADGWGGGLYVERGGAAAALPGWELTAGGLWCVDD
jgi:hypothetical protein